MQTIPDTSEIPTRYIQRELLLLSKLNQLACTGIPEPGWVNQNDENEILRGCTALILLG